MIENLKQAKEIYEKNIYGRKPFGETVTYSILEKSKRTVIHDPKNPFATMFKLPTDDSGMDIEIHVNSVTFTVRAYLPENLDGRKIPYIICLHPIQPKEYALKNGFALIFMDVSMIAEDNCLRKGCFYDLYPYGENPDTQTGELMAWSWGVSKVLDAIYGGLGEELNLDIPMSIVTGVSRYGKATAVCGAFDERIKITMPTCSGAGGLALWNYSSFGKTYDLSEYGCDKEYTYKENEPLSCLQSDAERGWFNDAFLSYKEYSDIPVEQYMLPLLAINENRYYLIVAAWTGEDWVNAPAMWECKNEATIRAEKAGLQGHIFSHFHKAGHAVLEEDLECLFELVHTIYKNS